MQGGKHHHWVRSIAFLAVWVVFGGLVIAGWLTQLHPSANEEPPQYDQYGNQTNSDAPLPTTVTSDTPPSVEESTVPAADFSDPAGNFSSSTTSNQVEGAIAGAKFGTASGTNTSVTLPKVSDQDEQTLAAKNVPLTTAQLAAKKAGKPITLTPAQATALNIIGGGASTTISLNKDDEIAHPFGIELGAYIGNLYQWAIVIGAGLAVLMIMWAGYIYVISAGDPEAVRQAKDYLWGALLGLALLILTYVIYNTLKISGPEVPATAAPTNPATKSGTQPPASGGSSTGNPSGGANPAATTDIFGSYTATITDISFDGTCGNAPSDPQYAKGSSQSVSVADAGNSQVTVTALRNTVTGNRSGNTVSIPDKWVAATFTPGQGLVQIAVHYTKSFLFASCTVTATIDGKKSL